MLILPRSRAPKDFFRSRLVHIHEGYEQRPGLVLADWRSGRYSHTQRAFRFLLSKVRQGKSTPLGLSKLPTELLDMIFRELCGREVHAARMVCREWETASRPYFAELHLRQSLFWLTGSDLRRLEGIATRFGPHMYFISIATDCFKFSGVWRMWRNYRRYAISTAERGSPGFLCDDKGSGPQYFRQAYRQDQPLSPWRYLRLRTFLWCCLCHATSQTALCITGGDQRRLARIMEMVPHGTLQAAALIYEAEQLNANEYKYGRASPAFAMELALLCGQSGVLNDVAYEQHVGSIVMEMTEMKAGR